MVTSPGLKGAYELFDKGIISKEKFESTLSNVSFNLWTFWIETWTQDNYRDEGDTQEESNFTESSENRAGKSPEMSLIFEESWLAPIYRQHLELR